ncbi:hypothetical protein AB0L85_23335 [Streptomyces sp. NPDC052051]|uniref:hypothetical protein n=1 Tax=Streptomyces sp. NPDC052051 TaxID=3154649 RepID=UPI00343EB930
MLEALGNEVLATTENAESFVTAACSHQPDVAVVDVRLPRPRGDQPGPTPRPVHAGKSTTTRGSGTVSMVTTRTPTPRTMVSHHIRP